MAKIIPFKAVRPVRDKAHLISSRPYYTYKKSLLKAKLEALIDAINEITVPTGTGPSGKPLNAATFTTIKGELSQILSKLGKTL